MKIRNLLLIGFIGLFAAACSNNAGNFTGKSKLKTKQDSASYALGSNVANSLSSRSGVENLNYTAFINGMKDVFEDKELKIEKGTQNTVIQNYLSGLREKRNQKNLKEGQEFLKKNKKKEGVKTTESGLQYKVIEEGKGDSPGEYDTVKVHYTGTNIDDEVFDSSKKRGKPVEFPVDRVIPGWTEGLQLMKEGAKYKFFIPAELAYGKRAPRGSDIEPNETLIFEVELLEVKRGEKPDESEQQKKIQQMKKKMQQ
jgi:FKBP-type peptidyl-prolyl cis-trans isomerase